MRIKQYLLTKYRYPFFFVIIIGIFATGVSMMVFHRVNQADVIVQVFECYQWKDFNFDENRKNMQSLRPLLNDENLSDVKDASKKAGIACPIIPYFDTMSLSETAKFYFAVYQREITKDYGYEIRFMVYTEPKDLQPIYSIWVSAIPCVKTGNNSFIHDASGTEFIYSVEDSITDVEKDMKAFFNNKLTNLS